MGRRRTWMIVLGIIALVISVPMLIGGAALAIIFGTDGTFKSGSERIDTSTRALVSAVAEVSGDAPVDRDLAGVRLQLDLTSASQEPLFVGVGRAADVSRYLDGVNVERIDDISFSPFRYRKTELPGERVPGAPGSETFWVAQAEGTGQQNISWRLRTGTYQVVIMNADAAPGVDVTGSLGIKIPWIFWVALGLLLVGLVFLVAGILLVVFGARRRKLPPGQAPPYGTPVGYTPVPGQPVPAGYAAPPGYGGPPGYAAPTPGSAQPPAPPAPSPTGLPPGSPLPPPPSPD